jgi:hypothetical protein
MRNDTQACCDGENGLPGYFQLFPLGFSALAGRANFGEIGDLIDHRSGTATDLADQNAAARRNRLAI